MNERLSGSQPRRIVVAHAARDSSRLARVVGTVEIATAATTVGAALRGELMVDAKQQGEELRVLQQGSGTLD